MLVFTRKVNQGLMIGDNVKVTVLSVTGDQIRIGIEAPMEVSIHRNEVYQAIIRQNHQASHSELPSEKLLAQLKI